MVIDLAAVRAARRDFTLEDRIRARRARAAQAEAAVARQAEIAARARVALTTILSEQPDPTSVA